MTVFNWFDIVLLLIILWSAMMGLRAGLARVVIGFAATVAGLFFGFWCYRLLAVKLAAWTGMPAGSSLPNMLGFFAIFVAALLLGSVIASVFARLFHWFGLSWFDHMLGGIAGFLRGAVVVAAIVDMVVAYSPSPTPRILEHSQVLPYVGEISTWLATLAPRELRDAFDEQMNNLKQMWASPAEKTSKV